jgi:glyoxylase-like metal-dependent hydrolase (beta-lactamase superfamily II)
MTPWTELAADLLVRESRAFRMNSVVLLAGDHALLVDPGVLPSEMDDIAAVVRQAGARSVTLVFTHAHWDHVLGRLWWPDAGTVAHAGFEAEALADEDHINREARAWIEQAGETWDRTFEAFAPDRTASGEQALEIGGWRLLFRDAPGHADSQMTIHAPDRRLMIAADMLSDIEIPTLNGSSERYSTTLGNLFKSSFDAGVDTLVPGHGSIARGKDEILRRFAHDIDYLSTLRGTVRTVWEQNFELAEIQDKLASLVTLHPASSDPSMEALHRRNIDMIHEDLIAADGRP